MSSVQLSMTSLAAPRFTPVSELSLFSFVYTWGPLQCPWPRPLCQASEGKKPGCRAGLPGQWEVERLCGQSPGGIPGGDRVGGLSGHVSVCVQENSIGLSRKRCHLRGRRRRGGAEVCEGEF